MPVSTPTFSGHISCWDRVKTGLKTGFCVGVVSGILFGSISCFRYRIRGRELVYTMTKLMLQGGGTFATFMGIGTVIRC